MAEHYKNILQELITKPHQPASTVNMMTAQELEKVLVTFNDTGKDYPKNKTIHELFKWFAMSQMPVRKASSGRSQGAMMRSNRGNL